MRLDGAPTDTDDDEHDLGSDTVLPGPKQTAWDTPYNHVVSQVASELRQHAPKFFSYWDSDGGIEPSKVFSERARADIDFSISQLQHIAARLRDGYDEP